MTRKCLHQKVCPVCRRIFHGKDRKTCSIECHDVIKHRRNRAIKLTASRCAWTDKTPDDVVEALASDNRRERLLSILERRDQEKANGLAKSV